MIFLIPHPKSNCGIRRNKKAGFNLSKSRKRFEGACRLTSRRAIVRIQLVQFTVSNSVFKGRKRRLRVADGLLPA